MSLGPYTIKNIPAVPGAYLIATIYAAAFPIYSSISAYGGGKCGVWYARFR